MNPAIQETKGSCNHCAGHFIFPAVNIGERIQCPHCDKETILLPIIESISKAKPKAKKQFPADEKWIQNIENDKLRLAAKLFHDLFSGFVFLLLIAIGIPGVIFIFVEVMRFLHFAWGHD